MRVVAVQPRQLRDARRLLDELGAAARHVLLELPRRHAAGGDDVVQQAGRDRLLGQPEVGEDGRRREAVGEDGLAREPRLAGVGARRREVGGADDGRVEDGVLRDEGVEGRHVGLGGGRLGVLSVGC